MIVGVDPGARRIGIAVADRETKWARPLEVIDSRKVDAIRRISEIVREQKADLVVVGKPVGLSGGEGPAVDAQRKLLADLDAALDVPVEEQDERLTTVEAERGLKEAGVKAATRKKVRDAVAAQVMLQAYVDSTT